MSATATALDTFTTAYIAAALQLSDKEVGADATIYDLSTEALGKMVADCQSFQTRCAYELKRNDNSQAGTDFWLTRNGHGTGFWDREDLYGEVDGSQFDTVAKTFGQADLYKGDDGAIYHYPAA